MNYCNNYRLSSRKIVGVNKFSKEHPGEGLCAQNYVVYSIKCNGKYYDNLDLACARPRGLHIDNTNQYWTVSFSNEQGSMDCPVTVKKQKWFTCI